jgi:hypothetical protein
VLEEEMRRGSSTWEKRNRMSGRSLISRSPRDGAVLSSLILMGGLWAVSGCDDATNPELAVSVSSPVLPVVTGSFYYEMRVRDAGGENEVSLGRFRITAGGELRSLLDDGPPDLSPAGAFDPELAAFVTIAVEAIGEEERGPVIVAGAVEFDGNVANITCTVDHPLAAGVDLTAAGGSFLLASPTDSIAGNETNGIWFVEPLPLGAPALDLPRLAPEKGWVYAAWVFQDPHAIPLGSFANPDSADSDGPGPEGWPGGNGFNAPGSDFVLFGMDLAEGGITAFITLEPILFLDGGHQPKLPGPPSLLHDPSFPFRLLATEIPQGAPAHSSLVLERSSPLPTALVTLHR